MESCELFFTGCLNRRVAVTTAQRGLTTDNSGSPAVQIWVAHPREF